jgi:acetyltransferase-like isoleucine patch superfamily enzyme
MDIYKLILKFKLDRLFSKWSFFIQKCEHKRTEQKCGVKINYVDQGFNGIKIISANNDFSKFSIHESSHLKSDTIIECSGGVTIGKYFHTGRGLTIFSSNHNYNNAEFIPYDSKIIYRPVHVKDFVWFGANITLVPGVTIGEGVVVGSGSVVTKDIPDYAVIGGNPAKIIKYRDKETFKKLKNEKKYY